MRYLLVPVLLLLAVSPVAATDFYEMHRIALCGAGKFSTDNTKAEMSSGKLVISVEQINNPDVTFWEARNANTGAMVWLYADGQQVQDLDLPPSGECSPDGVFGDFRWNPHFVGGDDARKSFVIDRAGVPEAGAGVYVVAEGIRVPAPAPPPPATSTVTIGLSSNQSLRGSVPVRITTSGFAAGTLKYRISIQGVQKWYWVTSSTAITQWWNTTAYPNGTHSVGVRVEDSRGKAATASVGVILAN